MCSLLQNQDSFQLYLIVMSIFQTIRKDSTVANATGLHVYVHDTLSYKRLVHLEKK